jgi:hypothetical protein
MGKMKRIKEISNDPYLAQEFIRQTELAETLKKESFIFQYENVKTPIARVMCAFIKEELTKDDSYDREAKL